MTAAPVVPVALAPVRVGDKNAESQRGCSHGPMPVREESRVRCWRRLTSLTQPPSCRTPQHIQALFLSVLCTQSAPDHVDREGRHSTHHRQVMAALALQRAAGSPTYFNQGHTRGVVTGEPIALTQSRLTLASGLRTAPSRDRESVHPLSGGLHRLVCSKAEAQLDGLSVHGGSQIRHTVDVAP